MFTARELFKQTAAGLGFPTDRLSIALLAFARLFSLPPNQALLACLRRDLLASFKDSSQGNAAPSGDEKTVLEAKALALVSALDKGVVLRPEALERYIRFLIPEAFGDREFPAPKGSAVRPGGGKENKTDWEEIPQAEELRAIAEEQEDKDDLLDFMNLLPGKNGQYWIVLPFFISVKGIELKITIRVLKGECDHLIADIVGPKRRWRCFINKTAGKFRADIRVYPELPARALKALAKEAERFLGEGAAQSEIKGLGSGFSGFEEILVRNGDEAPSWVEDLCSERLLSISEEV